MDKDPLEEMLEISQEMHGYCSPDNHCNECDGHLWDCPFCGAFQSMVCCEERRKISRKIREEIAKEIIDESK